MKEAEIKINVAPIIFAVLVFISIICLCGVANTSINANKEIQIKKIEAEVQLKGEPISSNE